MQAPRRIISPLHARTKRANIISFAIPSFVVLFMFANDLRSMKENVDLYIENEVSQKLGTFKQPEISEARRKALMEERDYILQELQVYEARVFKRLNDNYLK